MCTKFFLNIKKVIFGDPTAWDRVPDRQKQIPNNQYETISFSLSSRPLISKEEIPKKLAFFWPKRVLKVKYGDYYSQPNVSLTKYRDLSCIRGTENRQETQLLWWLNLGMDRLVSR